MEWLNYHHRRHFWVVAKEGGLTAFDDAALMRVLAADGRGFAPIPPVVARQVISRYGLQPVGSTRQCSERFYAITAERRLIGKP